MENKSSALESEKKKLTHEKNHSISSLEAQIKDLRQTLLDKETVYREETLTLTKELTLKDQVIEGSLEKLSLRDSELSNTSRVEEVLRKQILDLEGKLKTSNKETEREIGLTRELNAKILDLETTIKMGRIEFEQAEKQIQIKKEEVTKKSKDLREREKELDLIKQKNGELERGKVEQENELSNLKEKMGVESRNFRERVGELERVIREKSSEMGLREGEIEGLRSENAKQMLKLRNLKICATNLLPNSGQGPLDISDPHGNTGLIQNNYHVGGPGNFGSSAHRSRSADGILL